MRRQSSHNFWPSRGNLRHQDAMQSDRFGKGWGFRCSSQRKPGGSFAGSLHVEILQVAAVSRDVVIEPAGQIAMIKRGPGRPRRR